MCVCVCLSQRRLEDEVRQLENKFEQKKRQFLANSVKFRRELKRVRNCLLGLSIIEINLCIILIFSIDTWESSVHLED